MPHATDRIGEERRNHRPELVRRHVVQHIERGDAHHGVGIGQASRAPRRELPERHGRRARLIAPARAKAGVLASAATAARQDRSAGLVVPRRMERVSIVLQALRAQARTSLRSPRPPTPPACPCGNRCRHCVVSNFVREVRAGNAEAVIVPLVDHHEGALGHMAGHASERRVDPSVMVVRGLGVSRRRDIAGRRCRLRMSQLGAVRIVAVAAGHAGREHLALLERAVIVDLVEHLPVGVIEPAASGDDDACRTAAAPAPNPRRTRRAARGKARRSRPPCARSAGVKRCASALPVFGSVRPADVAPLVEANERAPCPGRRPCRTATSSAARWPRRHGASPVRGRPRSRR